MKRIAIIGGGISGLTAAYCLQRAREQGAAVEYVVFEQASRLGGLLQTIEADGCRIEAGPDSFLTAKPWARQLAQELGLADQLVPSCDEQRKTWMLKQGRLLRIPEGMQLMVPGKIWPVLASPLFSTSAKLRMARELMFPPKPMPAGQDEAVSEFVARHFGQEVNDTLAAPLLAGVYGGDASRLSARAVLPQLVEMEAREKSLTRALLRNRKRSSQPVFTSFRKGMQQLADALVATLDGPSLRTGSEVHAVTVTGGVWRVSHGHGADDFTHVLLAVPAYACAALLQAVDPTLAAELAAIPYTSSITVPLVFDAEAATRAGCRPPQGFGFLVPRSEGKHIFACTFAHNKFPDRAPANRWLLRAYLTAGMDLSDEQILEQVLGALGYILGLKTAPLRSWVFRWRQAMPQYNVGHLDRVQRLESMAQSLPGLRLIGNAYHGPGIPDCIREARLAVQRVIESADAR